MTDDDAIDLGEFLRSTEPKTNGKVRHNDKLHVFEGYDSPATRPNFENAQPVGQHSSIDLRF